MGSNRDLVLPVVQELCTVCVLHAEASPFAEGLYFETEGGPFLLAACSARQAPTSIRFGVSNGEST